MCRVMKENAATSFSRQQGEFEKEVMKVFCLEAGIVIASGENVCEMF